MSSSDGIHSDLRGLARWLPRDLALRWLLPVLRRMPAPPGRLPARVTVRTVPLEGRGGASVRVLEGPRGEGLRPAMLWIHGGGYVIGRAQNDDVHCARFAERLGAAVYSVDYRLAPEHPFPTPVDDCLAAWELLLRDAPSMGIDPARLVIGGASAGGGLAAALVLRAHDRGLAAPALQLLVYPMLDDRTVSRAVDERHFRVWNNVNNRFGWRAYLGRDPGGEGVSDHAAPARRGDLSGLAPAWIGVGTADLFHDEDLAYAARLREAGVEVTVDVVEGAFHGFDVLSPAAPVSRRFFDAQVAAIERAFARRA